MQCRLVPYDGPRAVLSSHDESRVGGHIVLEMNHPFIRPPAV